MKNDTESHEVNNTFIVMSVLVVVTFCVVIPLFAFELVFPNASELSGKQIAIGVGSLLVGVWYLLAARHMSFKDQRLLAGGNVLPESWYLVVPYVLFFGTLSWLRKGGKNA